jgi:hypothetical protein
MTCRMDMGPWSHGSWVLDTLHGICDWFKG